MPTMVATQLPQSPPWIWNVIMDSLPATGKLSTPKLGSCREKCLTLWLRRSTLPPVDIPLNAH